MSDNLLVSMAETLREDLSVVLAEARATIIRHPWFWCGAPVLLLIVGLLLWPADGMLHLAAMHNRPIGLARLARTGREWGKLIDTLIICCGVLATGILLRRADWRSAAMAGLLAAAAAGITANGVRFSLGRTRPRESTPMRVVGPSFQNRFQSYPSGHASTSSGYMIALSVAKPVLAVPAFLSGGLVVWGSFYAGSHYFSDVAVGCGLGTLAGLLFGMSAKKRRRDDKTDSDPASTAIGQALDNVLPGRPDAVLSNNWRIGVALLLLTMLLLLPGNNILPLMDRDEPRFAQATREMLAARDWVVPTFNANYRFDKPPLTYWMMAPGYRIFGDNAFGARFHSVFSTLLLAWLVFGFARCLGFRRRCAWGCAAAMVFSLQFMVHGRSAVADMPMVLSVTAVQFSLYELLLLEQGRGAARAWRAVLLTALVCGFLAKGPVAWLVPLVTLSLFRGVFWRRSLPWRRLGLAWVLPAAVLLVGLWGVPALLRTRFEFWHVGIGHHVVERGVRRFHGRLFVPLYYPFTAFISLFPWSMELGRIVRAVRAHWDARSAFMVAWLAAPMLIFLPYATQLPHYAMPGFPAFFLLLGIAWDHGTTMPRWGERLRVVLTGAGVTVAMALVIAAVLVSPDGGWRMLLAVGALLSLVLSFMPWLAPKARPNRLIVPALLTALCVWMLAAEIRALHVIARLEPALQAIPAEAECLMWHYREPSVVFVSNRVWKENGEPADVVAALARGLPVCVLALEGEARLGTLVLEGLRRTVGLPERTAWRVDHSAELTRLPPGARVTVAEGISPARGVWVRLKLICIDPR